MMTIDGEYTVEGEQATAREEGAQVKEAFKVDSVSTAIEIVVSFVLAGWIVILFGMSWKLLCGSLAFLAVILFSPSIAGKFAPSVTRFLNAYKNKG